MAVFALDISFHKNPPHGVFPSKVFRETSSNFLSRVPAFWFSFP